MHKLIPCLTFPVLLATALAQAPTDTLNLQPVGGSTQLGHTPRAGWTAVTAAGTTSPAGTGTGYGTWRNSTPAVSDGADAIYVFGGRKQSAGLAAYNDLYKFTASTGTLTLLIADSVAGSPTPRERHGACWNPNNGKMYIYAGFNFAGGVANPLSPADCLSDVWEYDATSNTWANVTPTSGPPAPVAREFAGLAYDPANLALVMFGGSSGATTYWNDTWLFFPNATAGLPGTWAPLSPVTNPPARNQHNLNTRFDVGDVVMDMGQDPTVTTAQRRFCDVWSWNGANWTLLYDYDWVTPAGTFPASTHAAYSCYDPLRQRLVHPGGQGISTTLLTGTSGTASCAPSNGDHKYLYFNNGTGFYEAFNSGPGNWTVEFDLPTNTWQWYSRGAGNVITGHAANDPVIGKVSRNGMAFAPSTGKVYMLFGQNGAATGAKPVNNVYEYQANPIALADPYGSGCSGLALSATRPWTDRTMVATGTGFSPGSFGIVILSTVGPLPSGAVPLTSISPPVVGPGLGCDLLVASFDYISPGFAEVAGQGTWLLPLPSLSVDPSLPGVNFWLQMAELTFSPFPTWVGTETTNGVACKAGAL